MAADTKIALPGLPVAFLASRKELTHVDNFDKYLRAAQSETKDIATKNVNLAAKTATQDLLSRFAIKHVVDCVRHVSKDSHSHKETAIFLVDSIMVHAAHYSDEKTQQRFERQFSPLVLGLFQRAVNAKRGRWRERLNKSLLNKIITRWNQRNWFPDSVEECEQVCLKRAPPSVKRQFARIKSKEEAPYENDNTEFEDGKREAAEALSHVKRFKIRHEAGAIAPPTPARLANPILRMVPSTPNVQTIMGQIPRTPLSGAASPGTPNLPGASIPMTPNFSGAAARMPMTPGANFIPGTPMLPAGMVVPGTPMIPGAGMMVPGTPKMEPFGGRGAPGTPKREPFGGHTPVPFTPAVLSAAPVGQPFTPASRIVPRTPANAFGRAAPSTPKTFASPFTPAGVGAQPFTPGVRAAPMPFTPGNAVMPKTPRDAFQAAGVPQPFTPGFVRPAGAASQPFTPASRAIPRTPMNAFSSAGAAVPFTPGAPGAGAMPFTPAAPGSGQPFTPAPGQRQPSTPGLPRRADDPPQSPRLGPAGGTPAGPPPPTPVSPMSASSTPAGPPPGTPTPQNFRPAAATPMGAPPATPAMAQPITPGADQAQPNTPAIHAQPVTGHMAQQPVTPVM